MIDEHDEDKKSYPRVEVMQSEIRRKRNEQCRIECLFDMLKNGRIYQDIKKKECLKLKEI